MLWLTVRPSALSAVGQALSEHSEVAFACATTGSSNLFAAALCRDTAHLYRSARRSERSTASSTSRPRPRCAASSTWAYEERRR
ncbi:hypothetical protein C8250_033335 [Streptomyces sp. So13.3]|uniref:Lrp/AsnC ligand binding domain-containing protein n=1 Tax=Streptomyces TaxID=1883 RepID=UPI0011074D93|nr:MULTISPECIES: Lrp/AsnC ligand binding domain-containing protein [Streptomyces]QNA76122.1 hypothetical protein C8250_033335 [Streptomyces sp. So13.3]